MKIRQEVLKLYQEYRDSPPTLARLIGRNLGRYLLLVFIGGLAMVLLFALQRPNHAYIVLGMLVGASLRDFATFRRFTQTWQVTSTVLDWDRVSSLLEVKTGETES